VRQRVPNVLQETERERVMKRTRKMMGAGGVRVGAGGWRHAGLREKRLGVAEVDLRDCC